MRLIVDGRSVFAATGGRPRLRGCPLASSCTARAWTTASGRRRPRAFAHHGLDVLPSTCRATAPRRARPCRHRRSRRLDAGADRGRRRERARWSATMGALDRARGGGAGAGAVAGLALVGVAAKMPVHPDLLAAADGERSRAVDMVACGAWARPRAAAAPTPGAWMLGGAERLLERAARARSRRSRRLQRLCGALAAAAKVTRRPARPRRARHDDAAAIRPGARRGDRGARVVVVPGAGHMLPAERPEELLAALVGLGRPDA